jgi:hypothetical protein
MASTDSALDRASSQADDQQLPPRHDAVLSLGKLGDLPIRGGLRPFSTIERGNGRRTGHGPMVHDGTARRARQRSFLSHDKQRLQPADTASGFDPLK